MEVKKAIDKLEKERRQKHISMEKFAIQEFDVTRATYSAWVNGKNDPQMENWRKIKDYLGE